jgi:peptide/nickel transport system permease protein
MIRFIGRRILVALPVLFGILFLVFALARLLPGDPCVAALGERASEETCAIWSAERGLDRPVPEQFLIYLQEIARGDLGTSAKDGRPVTELLIERLPATIELSIFALFLAALVGIPLGIISAMRRNSAVDVGTMALANLGVSTPVFVLGLVLAFLFAVVLKDTPFALPPSGRLTAGTPVPPLAEVWGLEELSGPFRVLIDLLSNMYTFNALVRLDGALFVDAFTHLILPTVALATIPLAIIARMTRSSLLDNLGLDYVRTARAKGLNERGVVLGHAMRNALLPVVTIIGLQLGGLLSGAVLTETIFRLGGMGSAIFEAIEGRDYAVIQGFTVVVAVGFLVVNLLVDLSYAKLDPRVRLG